MKVKRSSKNLAPKSNPETEVIEVKSSTDNDDGIQVKYRFFDTLWKIVLISERMGSKIKRPLLSAFIRDFIEQELSKRCVSY